MKLKTMIVLGPGLTVSKEFYDRIKGRIEDVLSYLHPKGTYTAEMLCGPDIWSGLKKGQHSLTGRCVMNMVVGGILPLEPVGCKHENPKRYRLK